MKRLLFVLIAVAVFTGCAGNYGPIRIARLEHPECINNAIDAARTWSHKAGAPVGIAVGPTTKHKPYHAQAFTLYEGELQWLEKGPNGIAPLRKATPPPWVKNGRQEQFSPIEFLTVEQAEQKYTRLIDYPSDQLKALKIARNKVGQ